jgi:Transcription elongation factor, GreA/GreB, C-term
MIDTFHWIKGEYRKVVVTQIADNVGRCGFCGGGRPASAPRAAHSSAAVSPERHTRAPLRRPGGIEIGSTVRALEVESGRTRTWTLVLRTEANPQAGKLSAESPIGVALLGRGIGDRVAVTTPRGQRVYIVEAVSR